MFAIEEMQWACVTACEGLCSYFYGNADNYAWYGLLVVEQPERVMNSDIFRIFAYYRVLIMNTADMAV